MLFFRGEMPIKELFLMILRWIFLEKLIEDSMRIIGVNFLFNGCMISNSDWSKSWEEEWLMEMKEWS